MDKTEQSLYDYLLSESMALESNASGDVSYSIDTGTKETYRGSKMTRNELIKALLEIIPTECHSVSFHTGLVYPKRCIISISYEMDTYHRSILVTASTTEFFNIFDIGVLRMWALSIMGYSSWYTKPMYYIPSNLSNEEFAQLIPELEESTRTLPATITKWLDVDGYTQTRILKYVSRVPTLLRGGNRWIYENHELQNERWYGRMAQMLIVLITASIIIYMT